MSSDRWFRPVDTTVGPDGAFYIADWYDFNLSHTNPKDRSQWYTPSRDDGRIWRVAAKGEKPFEKPFDKAANAAQSTRLDRRGRPSQSSERMVPPRGLADFGRTPRRVARPRAQAEVCRRIGRSLGPRSALGDPSLRRIRRCVRGTRRSGHPGRIRPRLDGPLVGRQTTRLEQNVADLLRLAKSDPSVIVRSQLACTAKRLPAHDALPIAPALVEHDEDAADPNVPLLIWWAIESKAASDRDAVLSLLDRPQTWQRPIVRDVLVERLARRYMAAEQTAVTRPAHGSCSTPRRRPTPRGSSPAWRRSSPAITSTTPAGAARPAAGKSADAPRHRRKLCPRAPPGLATRPAKVARRAKDAIRNKTND